MATGPNVTKVGPRHSWQLQHCTAIDVRYNIGPTRHNNRRLILIEIHIDRHILLKERNLLRQACPCGSSQPWFRVSEEEKFLFFVKSPNFYFPFFRKGIGWFVFISWEKWVSAGQNGRKIWGGNNSFPTRVRKTFLGNLLETKSSVVNRAMFVYPKLTRAEVERVINTQHRGKSPPPMKKYHLRWR